MEPSNESLTKNSPAIKDLPLLKDNQDQTAVGTFLLIKKRRSVQTAIVYEGTLREFFAFLDYKPVRTITYQDLAAYSEFLASPNPERNPAVLKVSTQNRKIATVKSFFKYCMKIGYIHFNPAEALEMQRTNSRVQQRILSANELEALLQTAIKKGKTQTLIVYFLALTGCRVSELTGLMWNDFFINPQGFICVNVHGKGHKDRVLKVPALLWQVIQDYRRSNNLTSEINTQDLSPFIISRYAKAYQPQSIWKMINALAAEAGIKKRISPHWIRHTFATAVAMDKNANIWQLQADMGHSNLTTTQIYVHIAGGMEDTSVDHLAYMKRLAANLNKVPQQE